MSIGRRGFVGSVSFGALAVAAGCIGRRATEDTETKSTTATTDTTVTTADTSYSIPEDPKRVCQKTASGNHGTTESRGHHPRNLEINNYSDAAYELAISIETEAAT